MPYSGEKKREYQLAWMKKRRDAWIESKGGLCSECSSTENLQVDHIDPSTKKMEPAAIWSRKESVRNEELDKCQVLCKTCHEKKTTTELTTPDHGASKYNRGCRCEVCTKAAVARVQKWRSSR